MKYQIKSNSYLIGEKIFFELGKGKVNGSRLASVVSCKRCEIINQWFFREKKGENSSNLSADDGKLHKSQPIIYSSIPLSLQLLQPFSRAEPRHL